MHIAPLSCGAGSWSRVTVTMTEMLMGIILTLLALIGFFFNIYIVLALVLTKQVSSRYLLSKFQVIKVRKNIKQCALSNTIDNFKFIVFFRTMH